MKHLFKVIFGLSLMMSLNGYLLAHPKNSGISALSKKLSPREFFNRISNFSSPEASPIIAREAMLEYPFVTEEDPAELQKAIQTMLCQFEGKGQFDLSKIAALEMQLQTYVLSGNVFGLLVMHKTLSRSLKN